MPIFAMIAGDIAVAAREHRLEVSEEERDGREVLLLKSDSGSVSFEAVVDAQDYLLREFIASRPEKSTRLRLRLDNVEIVSPRSFDRDFFSVPREYEVVGQTRQLGEGERKRLRIFEERLQKQSPAMPDAMAEEARIAETDDFLPALPAKLPSGFTIDSVTPLFFDGQLLYHVELVNAEKLMLISLFETKNEEFRKEFQASWREDGKHFLDRPLGDSGIYVVLVSEDVRVEELSKVYESLEFAPELAQRLVNQALARILKE